MKYAFEIDSPTGRLLASGWLPRLPTSETINIEPENWQMVQKMSEIKLLAVDAKYLLQSIRAMLASNGKREVARLIRINEATMRNYFNGKRIPTLDVAVRLALYQKVPIDALVDRAFMDFQHQELGSCSATKQELKARLKERFARQLAVIVREAGSVKEVAYHVGVSISAIYKYLNELSLPPLEIALRIARYAGVPLGWLVAEEGIPGIEIDPESESYAACDL